MGAIETLNQFLNFGGPALAVAAMVPLLARVILPSKTMAPAFAVQFAVNFAACMVVLLLGLWYWGRDGKMLTYLAMLLACATTQWLTGRGWKA